jgi:hypothetical protein
MPSFLSGPGLGLPLPTNLYPSGLQNAPIDISSNQLCLAPAQQIPLPAGDWYVTLGLYTILQFLDPVTGTWYTPTGAAWNRGCIHVTSDGFNVRIANITGAPVGAVVTNYGAGGYVQGSTAITVTGGTATYQPIIGGALATLSITNAGAGYGVAPIVFVPPPPPPANNPNGVGGVQAVAYAAISSGTVSGITFVNQGAGYPTAPVPVILPNPTDPNIASGITQATATFSVVASGSLTGVLLTNPGVAITPANTTLSVTGAGTQASCSAVVGQTLKTASVTGGGAGFGTVAAMLTTVGGTPPTGAIAASPYSLGLAWIPRPAQVGLAVTGAPTLGSIAAQNGTIYDGGLFLGAPTAVLGFPGNAGTVGSIVGPTLALTMGSQQDFVVIQPAP